MLREIASLAKKASCRISRPGGVRMATAPSSADIQGQRIRTYPRASHHHHDRIFDQGFEGADQLGTQGAIYGAVIAGQGHTHHMSYLDLAAPHDRPLLAGADGEDRGMRRVDDSGEVVDAIHAEVGDGRGAALIFLRLEFSRAGAG